MTSAAATKANRTAADKLAAPPEHNVVQPNGGTPTNGHDTPKPLPTPPPTVLEHIDPPAPEPAPLTVAALRKALQGVDGSLPVGTPQWAAGSVQVTAEGVQLVRLAKGTGGSTAGRKVMRLTDRGPLLAAFLKDQLGRKMLVGVTVEALAAAVDCSVSVLSYSVPSDPAQAAFAAAGITVTGPDDIAGLTGQDGTVLGYSVSKGATK